MNFGPTTNSCSSTRGTPQPWALPTGSVARVLHRDCICKLQPRKKHEGGLPLATLAFDSKDMLNNRIYGIREKLFHDPFS